VWEMRENPYGVLQRGKKGGLSVQFQEGSQSTRAKERNFETFLGKERAHGGRRGGGGGWAKKVIGGLRDESTDEQGKNDLERDGGRSAGHVLGGVGGIKVRSQKASLLKKQGEKKDPPAKKKRGQKKR